MLSNVVSSDFITRSSCTLHEDLSDGALTVENAQEVDGIIEETKARYNTYDERAPWTGDMHLVAQIPMVTMMELHRRGIVDDPKAFKKWLNDRDNRVFRTRPGRI